MTPCHGGVLPSACTRYTQFSPNTCYQDHPCWRILSPFLPCLSISMPLALTLALPSRPCSSLCPLLTLFDGSSGSSSSDGLGQAHVAMGRVQVTSPDRPVLVSTPRTAVVLPESAHEPYHMTAHESYHMTAHESYHMTAHESYHMLSLESYHMNRS